MSCPLHPLEFYAPGWHETAQTPVVDNKYYDRATGEVRTSVDHAEYRGPPSVDIIIRSQHEDTCGSAFRAQRSFPMEALLGHIMKIVEAKKLEVDSIVATKYSIRVLLEHTLTQDEFDAISMDMALGL